MWFWRAACDYHGTTINDARLNHPEISMTPAYIRKHLDEGQITQAGVIPKAVARAVMTHS